MLAALPERLNDHQLAQADMIARSITIAHPPATSEHFAACLRSMAILPRKADDESKGEHRAKLFARLLGGYSDEALAVMTRTVLETCEWFPSPATCKAILDGWIAKHPADGVKALARSRSEAERLARFNDLCALVPAMPQAEIDALPDRIKWALDDKMILRRLPNGQFVLRTPDPIGAAA